MKDMKTKSNFNYVTAIPVAFDYNYHLDDEVQSTEDYRELFEVLRMATENDVVRIQIQNFGGNLHTCISIVNAIRNSKAVVVGSLTSIAYSAASVIWLACDVKEVYEHAGLMAHDANGWAFGSLTQQLKQIEHSKKVLEGLYRDVYNGFLTEEEINSILDGGDIWLDYTEIIARLNKITEVQEENLSEEKLNKMSKKELIQLILNSLE